MGPGLEKWRSRGILVSVEDWIVNLFDQLEPQNIARLICIDQSQLGILEVPPHTTTLNICDILPTSRVNKGRWKNKKNKKLLMTAFVLAGTAWVFLGFCSSCLLLQSTRVRVGTSPTATWVLTQIFPSGQVPSNGWSWSPASHWFVKSEIYMVLLF